MRLKRNEEREAYARHLKRCSILEEIEKNVLPVIADQLTKNYEELVELDFMQHHKLKRTNQAIIREKEDGWGKQLSTINHALLSQL